MAQDRPPLLPNGKIESSAVEYIAARPIAFIEVQMAQAEKDLQAQLRAPKHRQAVFDEGELAGEFVMENF